MLPTKHDIKFLPWRKVIEVLKLRYSNSFGWGVIKTRKRNYMSGHAQTLPIGLASAVGARRCAIAQEQQTADYGANLQQIFLIF